jgi:uncharacterized damage-inducible protein DinB
VAEEPKNKAELLERMESSRRALLARLGAESEATLVMHGPEGGWSAKDHIAHIAAWERYLAALLTGGNRWTEMGLTAAPTPPEETAINEAIYERNQDLSLRQVYAGWDAAHQLVLDALGPMTDDDLMRPFSHYVRDATGEGAADPIVGWINGNTWGHYEEHAAWIEDDLARIAAAAREEAEEPQTVHDLVAANRAAREELLALIAGLDEVALSAPRGPSGWAVKDHLLHLAAWERGVAAMLGKRDRWNAMGLTDEQAEQAENADDINALLFEAHRGSTAQEALAELESAHQAMLDALATLIDADLQRAYDYYVPGAADPNAGPPIMDIINGNAWGHYAEHIEWIEDALKSGE